MAIDTPQATERALSLLAGIIRKAVARMEDHLSYQQLKLLDPEDRLYLDFLASLNPPNLEELSR